MSEPGNSAWPFQEIPEEEGLDISAIFGNSSAAPQGDPFAPPAAAQSIPPSPAPVMPEITPAVTATSQLATAPIVNVPAKAPAEASAENPIAAAFEQKTAENTKKGLLEKPPVFYHKGVKEEIDDPSMTFEELRIRKSDDFTDLEEGKRVSWSVEYCGIRKEVKDPKGTTIISMKEMIERSREFLDALKKTKDKDPCCYVKPKVEMKTKGNAAYKGKFGTLEEARNSDKVICLIPSNDGRIYELRKMEQGEFIAPKKNVVDFSEVRAGFSPALPKIPAELMGQIIAFFRAFMTDHGENEAFAQIYWDKAEKRFFAYVPKQSVCKEEVEADLHDCPYDDEERYKDAAIASFCATNVTERFDHLPENADEDAAPQLSPPQWLSAIELLRYPDRVDFRVDRRMVFQAIHQKLAQQVEEVQSDSIQIHNERYRLTKKDIRSNLERCLDMVKAQFPDKVPLIQEMIRSIR